MACATKARSCDSITKYYLAIVYPIGLDYNSLSYRLSQDFSFVIVGIVIACCLFILLLLLLFKTYNYFDYRYTCTSTISTHIGLYGGPKKLTGFVGANAPFLENY